MLCSLHTRTCVYVCNGILLECLSNLGVGLGLVQVLPFGWDPEGDLRELLLHTPCPLTYGVNQGSVSSPNLFNRYMKLLGEVNRGFGLWYADDTHLYTHQGKFWMHRP